MVSSYGFLWVGTVASVVALGGFITGWDIGIISGNLKAIAAEFELSTIEQGSLVSILFGGALAGCFIGGWSADSIGRKNSIHVQNVFYLCGSLSLFYATEYQHLLLGRFLMGLGTTMSSTCEVPFLCEFTDSKTRGRVGSIYEIMVTFGVLMSYVQNFITYQETGGDWRMGFGLPAIFSIAQSCALLCCPESPKWLLKRGLRTEAIAIYHRIYGEEFKLDDFEHVGSLRSAADDDAGGNSGNSGNGQPPTGDNAPQSTDLSIMKKFTRPFLVCCFLNVMSQLTGGTTVRVYAPTIFFNAGIGELVALQYNIVLGVVKMVVVLISVYFVDHWGRKKLLLGGNVLIMIGLLILCVGFSFAASGGVFLLGCAFVMGGYSISWGPVLYLVSSEMFPIKIRGRSLAANMLLQNLAQLVATLLFLPAIKDIGPMATFALCLALAVLTLVAIAFLVVETALKDDEWILSDMIRCHQGIFWKVNGPPPNTHIRLSFPPRQLPTDSSHIVSQTKKKVNVVEDPIPNPMIELSAKRL